MNMSFMTVEEFAKYFKMSARSVRRSIREGRIFATRPGVGSRAAYRIPQTEIERLYIQSKCEPKNKE